MNLQSLHYSLEERTPSPYDFNMEVGAIGTTFYLLNFNTGKAERLTWGAYRHCRDSWQRDRKYLDSLGYVTY